MSEPGIFEGGSFADYQARDAVSFSDLETWLAGRTKSLGRAGTLGNLLHARVLEGKEAVRERFERMDKPPEDVSADCIDRNGDWNLATKGGKAAFAAIADTGKTPVKGAEWEVARGMYAGIRRCKRAVDMLSRPAQTEVTVVAHLPMLPLSSQSEQPLKGPRFKTLTRCRIDRLLAGDVVDVKTTHHASSDMFIDSAVEFNYPARAAFYTDMVAAVRGKYPRWWWLCVSKFDPYDAWMQELTNEQMAFGRKQYQWLLRCYEGAKALEAQVEALEAKLEKREEASDADDDTDGTS